MKGLQLILWMVATLVFSCQIHAEDFLYFDPFLDGRPHQGEVETFTEDYETFYISIESLQEILHIHINIDGERVSGWQYFQNRLIEGDFSTKTIIINGQTHELNASDFKERDGLYFLWSEKVATWFDIKVTLEMGYLMVNFDTDGKHPLFESIKRRAQHAQIDAAKSQKQQMQEHHNRYDWFNWPSSDIRYSRTFAQSNSDNLVVVSAFDALAHNVNFLLNDNNGNAFYRMTVRKEVPMGDQGFNYEMGDIYFPAGKFLRTSFSGRGFALHGNELSQNHARHFQVEGQPGWDIELYREDQLIEYSKLDEHGRYTFEGIDVNAGFNNYKVVLYGPNGEVQEKHYNFNVSKKGLFAGKWLPEFYYIEPNTTVFGEDSTPAATGKLAVGHLNYGVSDNIHAGFGGIFDIDNSGNDTPFAELRYNDTDHNFDVGVAAPKSADSTAWSMEYSTRNSLGLFRINRFKTFIYDRKQFETGQLLSWHKAQKGLDMGLSFNQQTQFGIKQRQIEGQLGVQTGAHNFSTRMSYQDSNNFSSSILARLSLSDHLLQLRASLNQSGGQQHKQFNMAWRKRFDIHNVTVNSSYSTADSQWRINADYALDVDDYHFGARISHDRQNGWSLGLSFSTALVWDAPVASMSKRNYASASRIKTRAYWDKNNNARFDEEDEALSGVQFRGQSHWITEKTDEQGQAALYGAYSYNPQYVEIDPGEMDNPFLAPKHEKFKVTSHPGGTTTLDIPFYEHFELEGDVKMQKGDTLEGLGNVPLLLKKGGKIVKQINTEYDGYFLFDDIKPGQYTLAVDPKYIAKKAWPSPQTPAVEIELKGGDDGLLIIDPIIFNLPE